MFFTIPQPEDKCLKYFFSNALKRIIDFLS